MQLKVEMKKGVGPKELDIVVSNPIKPIKDGKIGPMICPAKYANKTIPFGQDGKQYGVWPLKPVTPELIAKRKAKMRDKGEEMSH